MRMKVVIYSILCIAISVSMVAQKVTHSEIVSRVTDNSATITLLFDSIVEVCALYGKKSGTLNKQTQWQSISAQQPAQVLISGVEANTQYFYSVCYRKQGSTDSTIRNEYSFHTQRPAGEAFTFVVQADPHMDNQSDTLVYVNCLKNQLNDKPDFMIDLGDVVMSDKLKNSSGKITHDTITKRTEFMRSYYALVCHSMPLYLVLGNHEGEAGWTLNNSAENVAIWNVTDRKKYFANPVPNSFYTGDETDNQFVGKRENYYAFTWGDALFIALDPYWYTKPKPDSLNGWRWTLGKAQYDWLKSTLEKSTAKFKFVFSHQLIGGDPDGRGGTEYANLYEWGGNNLDGTRGWEKNRPGWYKPIKDLLTEHRVTIFFHGHDHFFGKQEKNCLIYQETPQPSHPNFQNAGQADDYGYHEGLILPNSGHLRVNVSPDGVRVDYVRAYNPKNETASRKNGDVSASYFIGVKNCYDSLSTGVPIVWNSNYTDEWVYPNPFQNKTTIAFTVEEQETLSLTVYDANGALVRQLMDANTLQQGSYQIVWDGKNGFGSDVANGVYFYTLRTARNNVQQGSIVVER